MAEVISTVGPGKTYSTLQEWWDAVKSSSNAAQWAECYGGANLGSLNATGQTFTTTATDYVKIYAAEENRHNLVWDTNKAYVDGGDNTSFTSIINMPINYSVIDGLQIKGAGRSILIRSDDGINSGPFFYQNLLLIGETGSESNEVFGLITTVTSAVSYTSTYNCLAYNCGGAGYDITVAGIDYKMANCGTVNCGNGSPVGMGGYRSVSPSNGILYLNNCYALNTGAGACLVTNLFGTFELNNCATSDDTIDLYTNTNCLSEVETSGQLVNLTSNWKTLEESQFYGIGINLSEDFTTDAVGNTRIVPWWIGPYQFVSLTPPPDPIILNTSSTQYSGLVAAYPCVDQTFDPTLFDVSGNDKNQAEVGTTDTISLNIGDVPRISGGGYWMVDSTSFVDSLKPTNGWYMGAWVRLPSSIWNSSPERSTVMSFGKNLGGGNTWTVELQVTENKNIRYHINMFSPRIETQDESASVLPVDEWIYLSLSAAASTGNITAWVNGVAAFNSGAIGTAGDPSDTLTIGLESTAPYAIFGRFDYADVRYYNRELTSGEVLDLYENPWDLYSGSPSFFKPFLAIYNNVIIK